MYAVIKTGGKQYKVAKNDVIQVEKLAGEAGSSVNLEEVLLVADDKGVTVGAPTVDGATVTATVVEQARGDKIVVFKKHRRKNYRRKAGHRQDLTVLRIADIKIGAKMAAAKNADTDAGDDGEKPAAKKKAAAKTDSAPKAAAKKPAKPKAESGDTEETG